MSNSYTKLIKFSQTIKKSLLANTCESDTELLSYEELQAINNEVILPYNVIKLSEFEAVRIAELEQRGYIQVNSS